MTGPRLDLAPHIERIARAVLGEPNRELSTRTQLRYGRHGSLAVELAGDRRGSWYDHEAGAGGGPWDLAVRAAGGANGAALEWLRGLGIDVPQPAATAKAKGRIVATYDYHDEAGRLLFQVVRFADPKDFRQRRPDGRDDWIWSTKGIRQVPYRLPELLARPEGAPVYIVEGEKDADRLAGLGLCATTNPGGAGKWRPELNPHFSGADVVILPDADEAGRSHAQAVARHLQPVASSVRVVELPGLRPKGDVSDWLDGGGTVEELQALAGEARPCRAETAHEAAPLLTPYSDEALTLAFTARHADDLRYCDKFGAWFQWRHGCWRQDEVRGVFSLARQLCRDRAGQVLEGGDRGAERIATQVGSARTVAAVVNLARADARHATAPDDWDRDPWLLNTPGGLVDLRTGRLGPHDRDALCSKITAVAPGMGDCPLWCPGSSTRSPQATRSSRPSCGASRATA